MNQHTHRHGENEPIAVVGSACRFPGALDTPSKLWEFLRDPTDLLTKIPKERFNADAFYHPDGMHHGTTNVTESYLLREDVRLFDAGFFNIKPVEAHSIDPQQRVLMEVVYESLEAAGMPIESLAGSETGVYVGLMCEDYVDHLRRDIDTMPTYMGTGTARSIISNRISYFFDWHGPSMTIDTACSSSLVAVHQAVQLLRSGESNLAVAAGANLILGPELYIGESKLKMLAPGSRSRMWDVEADGYARGEGIAAVILKRLSDAVRDGDHIECIIRESGVNSDGRTKGITMPNQVAQTDLITRTYRKAGLDAKDPLQRCQYFEAHGTGTPAGDAREAEGIARAFFEPGSAPMAQTDPLYVGSIKTVIGHTEGTAGLAGFLKASLALQNSTIPPNLLFHNLSPEVAPFYENLEVASKAKPWPKLLTGPRRASVNNFGFGGTNSHVILENFEGAPEAVMEKEPAGPNFAPFVFSAGSETALEKTLEVYTAHLKDNPDISPRDLSFTLHSRRSALSTRATFPASSISQLAVNIDEHIALRKSNVDQAADRIETRPMTAQPRTLGVFTGQGAQWATMGNELIAASSHLRKTLAGLQAALDSLPEDHRPSWSLADELAMTPPKSRIGEALLSQTICTAVQVLLIDLLTAAGIEFEAVVGHSSGEIAAAYAAGFISREDAVKIAYYRGYFTTAITYEKKGAMMAIGTSIEDAREVCGLEAFEGRISVAACNSQSSVTLSGDEDAIDEVQLVFEEENKFARKLKVDKAYHSHHMVPCSEAYVKALEACDIRVLQGNGRCKWHSSVYPQTTVTSASKLGGEYWKDNMLSPVLFAQALENAAGSEEAFNIVIEVGPHPALKGPAQETLKTFYGKPLAYTGVLQRNKNDVEAFSASLGYVWARFSTSFVKFTELNELLDLAPSRTPRLLTTLPAYSWDHDRVYWHESRLTRAFNQRKHAHNALLGSLLPDGVEDEIRWRNLLRPSELPWIQGHQLQGQMVYPAAAYISSAVEAARVLVDTQAIRFIEIHNFVIGRALVFQDDQSSVETLFTLSNIDRRSQDDVSANFKFHAATSANADNLACLATGQLVLKLDAAQHPDRSARCRNPEPPYMLDVAQHNFYSSLEKLGYQYEGVFKSMSSMKRKLDYGSAFVEVPHQEAADAVLVHPALLDVAFQAIFLAYWWPGDGSIDRLHVPTSISSIRIDVQQCEDGLVPGTMLPLQSHLTENPLSSHVIGGDVDVFSHGDSSPSLIQVEGVRATPFSDATAEADRHLFSEHVWGPLVPDGHLAADNQATDRDRELATDLERISLYYMNKVSRLIPVGQRDAVEWHHKAMFDCFTHVIHQTREGKRRFTKKEWLKDTWEDISSIMDKYPDSIEVRMNRAVGENLPAAVRGETQILQHMTADNMLNRLYVEAMGVKESTAFLSRTVAQIVHRYPHMEILEIGAGTGGATKLIMEGIGRSFNSYTFTDISTGFFERAQEVFASHSDKMTFKALDCEKDVVEQGFPEYSYDLVIGSLVLHATKDLHRTLTNARRLLKPGGYLVILEITSNDVLWVGFAMSGLPGWWLGGEDGRKYSPCVSSAEWHTLMTGAGYSGIDTLTPEIDTLARPYSVLVTQAVDEKVNLLREPLDYRPLLSEDDAEKKELAIIGGTTLSTVVLIDQFLHLIRHLDFSITRCRSLHDISPSSIGPAALVLNLTELDSPIFQNLSAESMRGLQSLLDYQRTILWVTLGCRAEQPYMNMSVGFGRTVALEMPDICLQFLDLEYSRKPDARLVAEMLLRLSLSEPDSMLWSVEPEMVQEDGRIMIPRLIANRESNNRYNASRRAIVEERDPRDAPPLMLCGAEDGRNYIRESQVSSGADDVVIQVRQSTLFPIAGKLHGVLGTSIHDGRTMLGFATANGSRAVLASGKQVEYPDVNSEGALLLSLLDLEAAAYKVLDAVPPHSSIIVHEPHKLLAEKLQINAQKKNIQVVFTTARPLEAGDDRTHWLQVDRLLPRRLVKAMLPSDASIVVDCSINRSEDLAAFVATCLPSGCRQVSLLEVQRRRGSSDAESLGQLLTAVQAIDLATASTVLPFSLPTVGVKELTTSSTHADSNTVIDWEADATVPVQVSTVNDQISLQADKTYALFGLTSDLATSLCDWMVTRGARNFVLTSRNPNVDKRWLKQMQEAGVTVSVHASDITDLGRTEQLVSKIRRDLPPIAGIMHGAMVLQDTAFAEMSFETMKRVLDPKVMGMIHLDRLFRGETLDFFIMFSSLASAAGNRGQSNYSAANMFGVAKTLERRQHGLAASVVHIGAVLGVGFVMRELDETVLPAIYRAGFSWMEERGFHQCMAEAMIAGQPESGRNPEIVTGLRTINAHEEEPTPWMNNPRFQHCITWEGNASLKKSAGANAAVPIKTRLQEAATPEEVLSIIRAGFTGKLQAVLQLPLEDEAARDGIIGMSADDLGVDSLVAVEIRSWFIKELAVDMPVLKVLGGATIGDLLAFALEKLPAEMTPRLGPDAIPTTAAEGAGQKPSTQPAPTRTPSPSNSSDDRGSASNGSSGASGTLISSPELPSALDGNPAAPMTLEEEDEVEKPSPVSLTRLVQRSDLEKSMPMSPGQSGFWFLRHFVEDQSTFNITFSIKLTGALRTEKFEAAVRAMGQRHEALRTAFIIEDERTVQGVLKESRLYLERKTIGHVSEVTDQFEATRDHIYDIENGENMKITLLSLAQEEAYLVMGYHHINMDGASLEVFLADLERAYTDKPLSKSPLQYPDFSITQNKELEKGGMRAELEYWRAELGDSPAALPLLRSSTAAKTREPIHRYDHNTSRRPINPALASRIQQMCRKQKVNIFHFYLGVLEVMLFRLLGTPDLCIGMADANRFEGNLATSMGMYLNLLPLRFRPRADHTFKQVLAEVRRKTLGAMAHARLPFDALVDGLKVPRSTLHAPLFQAFINYRAGVANKRRFGGVEAEGLESLAGRTAYDISIDIFDNPGADTEVAFVVQEQLYSVADAELLSRAYFDMLDYFSRNPAASLADAPVPEPEEPLEESLSLSYGGTAESQWPETVVHLIDAMIQTHHDAIALKDTQGQEWTYAQMAQRIHAIASALLDQNIVPGSHIGVLQEPGLAWICSMLAVLRVGATYVPLDPGTPAARLSSVIRDCRPAALLVDNTTLSGVGELGEQPSACTINVSTIPDSKGAIVNKAAANTAAVILYTSGTTGTPKGVILSHRGLRNYFEWEFADGPEKLKALQHSAPGFDLGLWQSLVALVHGGTLIIAPRALRGDPSSIAMLMAEEQITHVGATPSEYLSWIQHGFAHLARCTTWRYAMSVGEQCPDQLLEDFGKLGLPDIRLFNSYGPSEATMGSSATELVLGRHPGGRVLAGQALTNRSVYVLGDDLRPLPRGATGEIYIGGAGVADGYLNQTALTSEKFLDDPLASDHFKTNGWTRMYRTGDKGRITQNGSLEVLGRIDGDTQIQLRGIRIELEDIENTIRQAADGAIHSVAVSARGEKNPFLVAHAVLNGELENEDAFLQNLATSLPLPQYMRPAAITAISEMPLTSNGKLDRKAVQQLPISQGTQRATAAAQLGNVEQQLSKVWEAVLPEEILKLHTIEPSTDFFHVGGNSMSLLQLQSRIKKELGVSLTVMKLFENSTLAAMAQLVADATFSVSLDIDWTEETALTKDVVDAGAYRARSVRPELRGSIILTGATGFLGNEILRQLVDTPEVTQVHCIAVRSASKLGDLKSSPKVTIHLGDLTDPQVGLSPKTASDIFGTATAIIHSGADVSFLKTYPTLRRSNLEATKELARLALAHGVPFHYISTMATGRLNGADVFGEESLAAHSPPPQFPDAYVATKWAGEVFLEEVNKRLGLPVWIHRPSSITGEGASDLDVMNSVVRFARQLRAVPTSARWRGNLDFVSLEATATGIMDVVLEAAREDREEGLAFLHHSGEVVIPVEGLREHLEKEDGVVYKELALSEWTDLAVEDGLNVLIAAYLAAIDEIGLDVVFQDLVKGETAA
ncbi:polyketide synthase peptide synthetase [Colletotrichum chrysophilum]|uniref:Polyketide synthase peptide synthetase n=1 Tax=Colletotrichum chrysophilum TaxID=1836956 RepID=A0AAD9A1S1_9PEZI|nr:polyketide synthase peptide synthetase [Colletotrichum chrysophilum]